MITAQTVLLIVNGVYWIDYIAESQAALAIVCSSMWLPFIVAKIVSDSFRLQFSYLLLMSTLVVLCLVPFLSEPL